MVTVRRSSQKASGDLNIAYQRWGGGVGPDHRLTTTASTVAGDLVDAVFSRD